MKNILYLLLIPVILIGCSGKHQTSGEGKLQCKLKKEREFVVGHFRNKHKPDTLFVELVDAKTSEYVPAQLDPDFDKNLELLIKRDTRLNFSLAGKSYLISDYEQVVGTSLLENLGDLNNDGLDEIGFVSYAEDFSMLNFYSIYRFSNGEPVEVLKFRIRDEMLTEKEPFVRKVDNNTVSCRVFDFEEDRIYKEYRL